MNYKNELAVVTGWRNLLALMALVFSGLVLFNNKAFPLAPELQVPPEKLSLFLFLVFLGLVKISYFTGFAEVAVGTLLMFSSAYTIFNPNTFIQIDDGIEFTLNSICLLSGMATTGIGLFRLLVMIFRLPKLS